MLYKILFNSRRNHPCRHRTAARRRRRAPVPLPVPPVNCRRCTSCRWTASFRPSRAADFVASWAGPAGATVSAWLRGGRARPPGDCPATRRDGLSCWHSCSADPKGAWPVARVCRRAEKAPSDGVWKTAARIFHPLLALPAEPAAYGRPVPAARSAAWDTPAWTVSRSGGNGVAGRPCLRRVPPRGRWHGRI